MPLQFPRDTVIQDNRNIPKDKQNKGFPKDFYSMVEEGMVVDGYGKKWDILSIGEGYVLLGEVGNHMNTKGVVRTEFNKNFSAARENLADNNEYKPEMNNKFDINHSHTEDPLARISKRWLRKRK